MLTCKGMFKGSSRPTQENAVCSDFYDLFLISGSTIAAWYLCSMVSFVFTCVELLRDAIHYKPSCGAGPHS